jgi:precorrin-2 dehydrogenase / sirohydrochlorin ferrochelatase
MNPYYPVFLNIKAKKCVVIGGGAVALRKVSSLIEHGASVTVVSPEICAELRSLTETGLIQWVRHNYQPSDLENISLAIVASNDNDVNFAAAKEARGKGILTNVVDEPGLSDFIVPSSVQRDDVAIAISTGGSSPALARKIRTMIEKEFGDEWGVLARLIGEVRTECITKGIKIDGEAWQDAIDVDSMISMIKNGKLHEAKGNLLDNLMKKNRWANE